MKLCLKCCYKWIVIFFSFLNVVIKRQKYWVKEQLVVYVITLGKKTQTETFPFHLRTITYRIQGFLSLLYRYALSHTAHSQRIYISLFTKILIDTDDNASIDNLYLDRSPRMLVGVSLKPRQLPVICAFDL